MRLSQYSILGVLCSLLALTGCKPEKEPLEGTRLSVINFDKHAKIDAEDIHEEVSLPPSLTNSDWSQGGGNSAHKIENPAFGGSMTSLWSASVGRGTTSNVRLITQPVMAQNRIFAMDTELDVVAFDASTGQELWRQDGAREGKKDPILGGGLAVHGETLVVASPLAEVIALDAKTGSVVWRVSTNAPVRAAPTIADGAVYVVTLTNQLNVYDLKTGKLMWTHAGITEHAGLLGMAAPAVDQGIVVATYSSGEVVAIKAQNGYELWTETLSPVKRPDSLAQMSHVRALPVIHNGRVYVFSHNQRLAAIDLRSGGKLWERSMGGLHQPAVAGNFLFIVTNEQELICLTADKGQVVWVTALPRDEENSKRSLWAGPVLAGDALYVIGREGEIMSFSPQDGALIKKTPFSGASVSPIVADRKMVVATDSGQVVVVQ